MSRRQPQHARSDALRILERALAGARPPWPKGAGRDLAEQVLAEGTIHGALPLLYESVGDAEDWPATLRRRIADATRAEAVAEAVHAAHLARALGVLAGAGVETLVFKGTALAHTVYPRPTLRPRDDTDLLVTADRAPLAIEALERAGFARARAVAGTLISHQACLSKTAARGVRVNLDLHWRISNRPGYARALDAAGLLERAVAAPGIAPGALVPGPVDALLLAAAHLHGHHREQPRLVWLLDFVLLGESLGHGEAARAVRCARRYGLEEALGESLARAHRAFGCAAPAPLDALAAAHDHGGRSTRRQLHVWREDLAALPGWRARAALLAEHALPSAEYMLGRYGTRRRGLLPVLYLHRALAGALRLLRPAP